MSYAVKSKRSGAGPFCSTSRRCDRSARSLPPASRYVLLPSWEECEMHGVSSKIADRTICLTLICPLPLPPLLFAASATRHRAGRALF